MRIVINQWCTSLKNQYLSISRGRRLLITIPRMGVLVHRSTGLHVFRCSNAEDRELSQSPTRPCCGKQNPVMETCREGHKCYDPFPTSKSENWIHVKQAMSILSWLELLYHDKHKLGCPPAASHGGGDWKWSDRWHVKDGRVLGRGCYLSQAPNLAVLSCVNWTFPVDSWQYLLEFPLRYCWG